ncbi:EAL domain-containing protein [Campylobacter concisus]|uniref:EAL domain-containing protein n=1 Tax=Campylobacter concisus TaxID=199 RepID=UPI000CD7F493|nr:GGDEF domain-containing phosphodiesterase [Campylobacter concisus]
MPSDESQKKHFSMVKTVTLVVVLLFAFFVAENLTIYSYKYNNALSTNNFDLKKKTEYLTDQYVNYFKNISKFSVSDFQNYIADNAVGDVFLLKENGKNGFKIEASSDKSLVNKDYEDKSCGDIYSHDFQKDYLWTEILPENSAKVCMFVAVNDYILGFKAHIDQRITGTSDQFYFQWLMKNMALTLILSSIGLFLGLAVCLWFVFKYLNIKFDYLKVKEESTTKIAQLQEKLYIDPMTGLFNKAALIKDVSEYKYPKVILMDIDDFGKMNDYYGKYVCDQILKQMANLIKEFAKNENMKAYCIEADRFALVEDNNDFIDRYEELAENLLDIFKGRMLSIKDENGVEVDDIEIHNTIGFALDSDQTLRKATIALKSAKSLDKDYVCYFKGLSQKDEYANQIERSKLIQNATINDNIVPYFQPIFDEKKIPIKYECLIRILDRDDVISPSVFLDISKRIKRYADLEKQLIKKCFEHLIEDPNLVLSINLSSRDMIDGDVSALVLNLLNKHNVAGRIVFEIVEDEELKSAERVSVFIERAKSMGAMIAIDDFGSGYSNFSYIIKIKPDYVKIDGSIIKDIDINKDSYAIASAIVAFAKDLGIKTIAEYVHSKEIFNVCKEIGIDEFQGFYLGIPSKKAF